MTDNRQQLAYNVSEQPYPQGFRPRFRHHDLYFAIANLKPGERVTVDEGLRSTVSRFFKRMNRECVSKVNPQDSTKKDFFYVTP